MEYIVQLIICVVLVSVVAFIVNLFMKPKVNYTEKMSFKESLDLVDLPVVTFRNNNIKLHFLLDTGASISVFNSTDLVNIKGLKYETKEEKGTIYGMEGNPQEVNYINMNIKYKDNLFSEEFQVVDMSNAFDRVKQESGVTINGILSSAFFSKYKYILDYNDMVAYSIV